MLLNEKREAELKQLYKKHRVLRPIDVIKFAQNPKTALHSAFTWDDTKAAHEYRLLEARKVIQLVVVSKDRETPRFVSLRIDRIQEGGGYRDIDDVMRDSKTREMLLLQAQQDAQTFANKYSDLIEYADVITVIKATRKKLVDKQQEVRV